MSAVAPETVAEQPAGKSTTIAALKTPPEQDESRLASITVGFVSLQSFQLIWRIAKMFAASSIVPDRFQGKPENCAIAVEMAQRLGASPLMVMQNLYIVYGNPGWAAKFLIASFNQSGRYTSIRFAFEGTRGKDDWGARAWAIEKSTGERLEGPLINIELAKKEGWYARKDSKWQTMPEQMLRYRAAAWFINTVAPEISMGIRSTDELDDIFDAKPGPGGHFVVDLDELRTDTKEPERKALPDPTSWANTLSGAVKLADLETAWRGCREAFGGSPPNECDSAYQARKEALGEKEGKQLEL